jgi:hypothetical protein
MPGRRFASLTGPLNFSSGRATLLLNRACAARHLQSQWEGHPVTRCLAGVAAALIGLGLIIPAIVAWREQGAMPFLGYTVLVSGGLLVACGIAAAMLALLSQHSAPLPPSVLGAVTINALFLGLLALEISHGLSRQGGVIAKSAYVFPPALAVFWGLVSGHRWTWHLARWGSLLFALVYFSTSAAVCIFRPTDTRSNLK